MTDKPYNAGDEIQVKEREKKEKTGRDRELDDLKSILETRSGRRFICRLLDASEFLGVCQSMNAHIYFLEGKRSIGKLIFHDVMKIAPEAYSLMGKERDEKL